MSAGIAEPIDIRAALPSDVEITVKDGDAHADLGGRTLPLKRQQIRFEPELKSLTIVNGSIHGLRIDCGSEKGRELNLNSVRLRDVVITGWGYNLCLDDVEVADLVAREAESFELQSGGLLSQADVEARVIRISCDEVKHCRFLGVHIEIESDSSESSRIVHSRIEGLSANGKIRVYGAEMADCAIVGSASIGELDHVELEACTVRPVVLHWEEKHTRHVLRKGDEARHSWLARMSVRTERAFAGPHWRPDVGADLKLKDVKFHNVIVDVIPLEQVTNLKKVDLDNSDLLDKWEIVREAYSWRRLGIPLAMALIYILPLLTYLESRGDFHPDETWWMVLATGATGDWRLWPIAVLGVVIPLYVLMHLVLTAAVARLHTRAGKLKTMGFMRTRPGRRRYIWIYRIHWPWMVWALVLALPIGAWKLVNAISTIIEIMG